MNFFDEYSQFYHTSKTKPFPNRLNKRYEALIESNINLIKNKSILDIASHDGRWSFAALKNDAKYVLGIEGRKELVENSIKNMKMYKISDTKYDFVVGDIHEEIKKLKQNTFETVFCFGFFYHTLDHNLLLREIKRLNPKNLILDTVISNLDLPIIELIEEDSDVEMYAIKNSENKNKNVLVGHPSKKAIEHMLENLGFEYHYYDWHDGHIQNWNDLESYESKRRITLVAKNLF
jgi:16S rRNA G966 N2-methylase RsmD